MARKKTKAPGSLAKTRPRVFDSQAQRTPTMSRKAGRKLINTHHTLEKQRKQAAARGDAAQEHEIAARIAALGGLDKYQQASLQGQRPDRGGDTSKVLLEWLAPSFSGTPEARIRGGSDGGGGGGGSSATADGGPASGPEEAKEPKERSTKRPQVAATSRPGPKLRMLEVGALSTQNACSTSGIFDMELIDLNSREPGILQQDFMQRPLPQAGGGKTAPKAGRGRGDGEHRHGGYDGHDGRFDVISLSLVLNFVPDARGRGEMLRRTLEFLRPGPGPGTDGAFPARRNDGSGGETEGAAESSPYPCLFVVLPRPCVSNSRYFTGARFVELMALLGYEQVQSKLTDKLVYYLWRRRAPPTSGLGGNVHEPGRQRFAKKEINPGGGRNNFAIVLESPLASSTVSSS